MVLLGSEPAAGCLTGQGPRSVEPPGTAAKQVDSHEYQCLLFARSRMECANTAQMMRLDLYALQGRNVDDCFAPHYRSFAAAINIPKSCHCLLTGTKFGGDGDGPPKKAAYSMIKLSILASRSNGIVANTP